MAKKRYLLRQQYEKYTLVVVIEDPRIEDGTVYGVKVGNFTGWENHDALYERCDPVEYLAGGGPWTITEFKGRLM